MFAVKVEPESPSPDFTGSGEMHFANIDDSIHQTHQLDVKVKESDCEEEGESYTLSEDSKHVEVMAEADHDKACKYGGMKTSVAQQSTYGDCLEIAPLLDLPSADRENIKNGLSLLREKKSLLSADDVEPLRKCLVQTEHHQAAAEVDKYREPMAEECVDGQDNKQQQKPDYTKPHMKQEVSDPCLSQVAQKLGKVWKQFSIQKLKLTQPEIDICMYNNRDNLPDVIFDCLYKWKANNGTLATFELLAKLLFEFGCAREVWIVLESPE